MLSKLFFNSPFTLAKNSTPFFHVTPLIKNHIYMNNTIDTSQQKLNENFIVVYEVIINICLHQQI